MNKQKRAGTVTGAEMEAGTGAKMELIMILVVQFAIMIIGQWMLGND